MLFVYDQPLFWLPMIGTHLLFFSSLTLSTRLNIVDWAYLKQSSTFILPAALIGVFGLINLPNYWLLVFIYSLTLFYSALWLFDIKVRSEREWIDRVFLAIGGYVAGTSLTGAPLLIAIFMKNVSAEQLRNTLLVLWFVVVSMKLGTFVILGVKLHLLSALMLLPVAAIGHYIGLIAHDSMLKNDRILKRVIGGVLMLISLLGLWKL